MFPRRAPETLRSPTSLARPAARAVARFMKLMQAMRRTSRAIMEKLLTLWSVPTAWPKPKTALRRMSVRGMSMYRGSRRLLALARASGLSRTES